jgi:hypothetical protein
MTTASAKSIANGQTLAERKLAIDRLEAVLQGMIIMLRDCPDVPVPWHVDFSCCTDEDTFNALVQAYGLQRFANSPGYAYLAPLADKYSAAEDRRDLYMPWSVIAEPKSRPL